MTRTPQKEVESLNIDFPRTNKVVKELPPSKALCPDSFTGDFYYRFKEQIILVLFKLKELSDCF